MPSTKKTLYFLASAASTSASVGILGYAMSTKWALSILECSNLDHVFTNGSAVVQYQLFSGVVDRKYCPEFGGDNKFQVLESLAKTGGVPQILYAVMIFLLALCLLCSAGSILVTLYNSVSNPYETYMGPVGLYTCSSLSACISLLVLVLYVVIITLTSISQDLVQIDVGVTIDFTMIDKSSEFQMGYFLMLPYMGLCLLSILLVYLYEHAAYTHRQQQQKPTEDAPKEIMMY
ncbi:hypothetical protein UPYG_G00328710 [Umbra pygmaea]|uniref:Clarin 3 n=1 Tax=Umbra pygmaea TaxID=75934 RepID=A0ABD0W1N2_UMBPY